jgi:hypothetical protein
MFEGRPAIDTERRSSMKRLLIILIAGAVPLLLAPAAHAKGPVKAIDMCGDGGCASIPISPGRGIGRPEGLGMLLATPATKVPGPQPYVDLTVVIGRGEGTLSMFYVPGVQTIYYQGWSQVPPTLGARLDAAAARLGERQPTIGTVVVGDRMSRHPGAYAPLLSPLEPARAPDAEAASFGIEFTTTRNTPWTFRGDGYATYVPSAHVIRIGLDWFTPPAALDAQIRRDAAATTVAAAGSRGGLSPWWLAMPGVALAAGLIVALARRRRGQPRTVPVA